MSSSPSLITWCRIWLGARCRLFASRPFGMHCCVLDRTWIKSNSVISHFLSNGPHCYLNTLCLAEAPARHTIRPANPLIPPSSLSPVRACEQSHWNFHEEAGGWCVCVCVCVICQVIWSFWLIHAGESGFSFFRFPKQPTKCNVKSCSVFCYTSNTSHTVFVHV